MRRFMALLLFATLLLSAGSFGCHHHDHDGDDGRGTRHRDRGHHD